MRTKLSVEERFWLKVDKTDSCWNWTAFCHPTGYGYFNNKKSTKSHRFSYELIKGKIPQGLVIDHLCRNRKCVNPEHLEAVTHKENIHRGNTGHGGNTGLHQRIKTHCPQGHEYNEENTWIRPVVGWRQCRICNVISKRKYDRRKILEKVT